MAESEVFKPKTVTSRNGTKVGRLFVLDLSGGRILSLNPNGSDSKVIVTGCRHPDALVVDVESGTFTGPTWEFRSK